MNLSGLLIGGVVPAVLLGVSTVMIRYSTGAGASTAAFVAMAGTAVAVFGWIAVLTLGADFGGPKAIGGSIAMAAAWAGAVACMAYGFGVLKLPVSVVSPLTNSNALVAVLVGAILFGEWRHLNMLHVAAGTLLMCAGAALVSI